MTGNVRSVSAAFAILRLVAKSPTSLTLTDISRACGLSPSTCLNLLRTLVAEGVLNIADRKQYSLASAWRENASLFNDGQARFVAKAQPLLHAFAKQHDVTAGLWAFSGKNRLELIAVGENESATRVHMVVGQRQPIGAGSVGKALAAQQQTPRAALETIFRQLRFVKPCAFEEFEAEVQAAKRNGFAVDDGKLFAGRCSVACIIMRNTMLFSLSATTFSGIRDAVAVETLARELQELGREMISF